MEICLEIFKGFLGKAWVQVSQSSVRNSKNIQQNATSTTDKPKPRVLSGVGPSKRFRSVRLTRSLQNPRSDGWERIGDMGSSTRARVGSQRQVYKEKTKGRGS
jgi:hypothetical protein